MDRVFTPTERGSARIQMKDRASEEEIITY